MRRAARDNEPRARRAGLADGVAGVLLVGFALAIGQVRPGLVAQYDRLRHVNDVYALPTPEQTVVLSLGYRSALADLVYANTLVGYGIRTQERRRFEFAANYLDTAIALDPTLRETYYFADTILTLQAVRPPYADYLKAREIQLRGLDQFPYDAELWIAVGQYIAYLAPGQFPLDDAELQREWRTAGAKILARACDLVAGDVVLTRKCIGAAQQLTRAGEREAVIRLLERILALSSDEETRAKAKTWLEQKLGETVNDELVTRQSRLDELRRRDLPFVSREAFLLLGPPFDPNACAGEAGHSAQCATTWPSWLDATDAAVAPPSRAP